MKKIESMPHGEYGRPEIEKGIPMTRLSKKARFEDTISRMAIGDSIVLYTYNDVDYFRQVAHRKKCKVASRTEKYMGKGNINFSKPHMQNRFRVWRIK